MRVELVIRKYSKPLSLATLGEIFTSVDGTNTLKISYAERLELWYRKTFSISPVKSRFPRALSNSATSDGYTGGAALTRIRWSTSTTDSIHQVTNGQLRYCFAKLFLLSSPVS